MVINLTNNINNLFIEKGELDNEEIINWFSMNEKFIEKMIKSYIREYGWAFGGASEMYLDLKQLYREYPYDLEEKYGEELSPSTYSILMAA
jgi:hypothetical protein